LAPAMTGVDPFGTPSAVARRTDPARDAMRSLPRVLWVGNMPYDVPLPAGLAKKWDAVSERIDVRVVGRVGAVRGHDPRFRLIRPPLSGVAGGFYLALPRLVASEVKRFRPEVVIAQSPYEAFAARVVWPLLDPPPKLVVEVHGDWRTAARLYGSPFRRALAPLADRAALVALRRADGTRALTSFTRELVEDATARKPLGSFPTYFDIESFSEDPPRPLPTRPAIAWIAVLERYKNLDRFDAAWRLTVERLPSARVVMVGHGSMQQVVDRLARDLPGNVTTIPQLSPPELSRLLDQSTALVLPSRSEGTPRVIMEAFARGRPVIGSTGGGIPDLVKPGHNGLLVEPHDVEGLAVALVRILSDRGLAEDLARGAAEDGRIFRQWTPDRYADAVRTLVDRVLEQREAPQHDPR
jgi:glycosyltransferase involved in cell wall biosynthesis